MHHSQEQAASMQDTLQKPIPPKIMAVLQQRQSGLLNKDDFKPTIYIYKSWVECPRFARFISFLRKLVFMFDLKLESLAEDKGFIRSTYFFEVSGTEQAIESFKSYLCRAIDSSNADSVTSSS